MGMKIMIRLVVLQILFSGLLSQLLIRWKMTHYLHTFHKSFVSAPWQHKCLLYLWSACQPVSTRGFCCCFHIFDWHLTGSGRPDGRLQSDEVSETESQILDQLCWKSTRRCWICRISCVCSCVWKEVRFNQGMFLLWSAALCDHFSQLNGSWLKTNRLWFLFFIGSSVSNVFLAILSCLLTLNSQLFAEVCWCYISFKAEHRQAKTLDANVMVINQRATHTLTHMDRKETHTY